MRPEFDARDAEILSEREALFNQFQGPRVGDFLRTSDGMLRFTHDWGDTIQTTVKAKHPCYGDASFYLSDGYASFSGSLDPGVDKAHLQDTGETLDGSFWFFHHNHACAENGVYFTIKCRVFELSKFPLYNVIRWPDANGSWWLVSEASETSGYTPIMELHPRWNQKREMEPTYQNQLWCAAELLAKQGRKALMNPHVYTGRDCKCGECFCCAAVEVYEKSA